MAAGGPEWQLLEVNTRHAGGQTMPSPLTGTVPPDTPHSPEGTHQGWDWEQSPHWNPRPSPGWILVFQACLAERCAREGRLLSGWNWGRHHKQESEPPHFPGLHTCVKLSVALGAGRTALSKGWIWGRLLLRLCKGPGREGKSWQRFRVHWFSKGDAATFQCFLGQKPSQWGYPQSQGHAVRHRETCGLPGQRWRD